ncbi:alpha-L-fucosidase [Testudinibacter sp. TR-2022]|uniref:alpha-L-fucosidase n=1 Tax=Testudinibacter sp. TR-2022 TaxID=2585029 RepID=UPI0011181162|nr:alpha-L-fucosidase [Testudinibacter sp. TR-2022]TNH06880.1 alpha-L-fucosidase [Pasteurellaceae bacterium Phil11]TNH21709.1 alpha-L-fucosidase [Testudinibacter sp. TR-2022]TNH28881.1 alpha-L-fucosidase [Testudinibacter sp. TR-2022]
MKKFYSATWESVKTHPLPDWYDDYKFGIFIHWGIYSVPAFAPLTWELGEIEIDEQWFCNNPYAEWYFNSINVKQGPTYQHHLQTYGKDFSYRDFLPLWKAEKWQPAEWAQLFKQAGAKYVVLTTKHHDGFCLFPSRYTDYHCLNHGPKRDILGDLKSAVEAVGLKMGTYYSGVIDWTFSCAPIFTESQNMSNASPTYAYADYAFNQVLELIDDYQPAVLWNDIGWPKQGEHMLPSLFSHYYNQVEDGVVDDRWNGLWCDFTSKEYKHGEASRERKWEMCRGLGLSFGYNQNESDDDLISVEKLVALLVEVVANNGNLLLNVGPKADGTIPNGQVERLTALGNWLEVNGEGIYASRCSHRESYRQADLDFHFTKKETDLYCFVSGLHTGETRFSLPCNTTVSALNPAVEFSQQRQGDNVEITVHNYQSAWQVLCFKAVNGE